MTLFPRSWRCVCGPLLLAVVLLSGGASSAALAKAARSEQTYLQTGGRSFQLDIYSTPRVGHEPAPALVFFHGGAWTEGGRGVFRRQALALTDTSRLVVFSADYPLNRDPVESTRAAQAAICWVRKNAGRLGVDIDRIAVSGASAGGQLAVAAALAEGLDVPQCEGVARPWANAFVLFNPALDLKGKWENKLGLKLREVSPVDLLRAPLPPTIIFQGSADTVTPLRNAELFVDKARQLGAAQVELHVYAGRTHGFFGREDFTSTMDRTRAFLDGLGWLE